MAATIANLLKCFAGRISLFHLNWRVLSKDKCVLQTVTEGSHIPLLSTLWQEAAQPSVGEVHGLLEKPVIQSVPNQTKRFYSGMFMVPKKDGGQRPVINLKRLNNHVKSEHFKTESLLTVKSLLYRRETG